MSKNTALSTASVLAFERKLDPSDAVFYSGNWEDRKDASAWKEINVREKSVRGTISNRMKGSAPDPAKFDADIQKPNLQTVDVCTLPAGADSLKSGMTLRILGDCGKPSACNNADYQAKLAANIKSYGDNIGYAELARRYAHNIANGRMLWRNRVGAESVEVRVRHLQNGVEKAAWTFDSLSFSLRNFEAPKAAEAGVTALANVIEAGLSGAGYTLLEITLFARMGAGQEVFPSQELILDKKDKKSKTLYHVDHVAAMHSQKVGNALRTIDTWYEGADSVGPISVEPYGSVTSLGKAFRQPAGKQDFYNLLDGWMIKDKVPSTEQQHYVIANLIRGGVYGESEKAAKE